MIHTVFPAGRVGQALMKPGRPVEILTDLAWPEPAGLVKPEPGEAGPAYRPYRLFPDASMVSADQLIESRDSVSTAKFTVNIS